MSLQHIDGEISDPAATYVQESREGSNVQHRLLRESLVDKFDTVLSGFDTDENGKIGVGEVWHVVRTYLQSQTSKRRQRERKEESGKVNRPLVLTHDPGLITRPMPVRLIDNPSSLRYVLAEKRITMIFFYTPW